VQQQEHNKCNKSTVLTSNSSWNHTMHGDGDVPYL